MIDTPGVLLMRYDWRDHTLIIVHNFTSKSRVARLDASAAGSTFLTDLLWTNDCQADEHGRHVIELDPYAYRWFRGKGVDRSVPRQ